MKIFAPFNDIATDLMVAFNNNQLPSPITAADFIHADVDTNGTPKGIWWIERDDMGQPVFCTEGVMFSPLVISLTDANGNNPYTVEMTSYIKDHPIHRPK